MTPFQSLKAFTLVRKEALLQPEPSYYIDYTYKAKVQICSLKYQKKPNTY
jgi:hypothetical protein